MKKLILRILGIGFLIANFSCEKDAPKGCIDKSKITDNACAHDYNPVCGCDNKTYSNSCFAEGAGVTSYRNGACK